MKSIKEKIANWFKVLHSHGGGRGFSMLYAVLAIVVLLSLGSAMLEIAVREVVLSSYGRDSRLSFYAADSGIDCAIYWDLAASDASAFATSTPGVVTCNTETITTGSQTVPTNPAVSSRIGGGGDANPTSIFYLDFNADSSHPLPYCVIVIVNKSLDTTNPSNPFIRTKIESRGYNTCDVNNPRRVERAIRVTY